MGTLTMNILTSWPQQQAGERRLMTVSDRPVISREKCAETYGDYIYEGIMCIDTTDGHGVCSGDSGGPLQIRQEEQDRWTQVGLSSFVSSEGCANGSPHG